ncbi:MAG: cell envelope integrity protein TolA [Oligoflexia bacterium]|nr:cell envelope integrity protein TolA [Oligoflexia bacterium]
MKSLGATPQGATTMARPAPRGAVWSRRPTWEIPASIALHGAIVAIVLLGHCGSRDSGPLIDPTKVMQVHAVALPKSTSTMPNRPSRTPDAPKGSQASDTPPPPPTASEMALKKHDAEKPKGDDRPKDRSADREALLRQAKRQALLKDPTAPIGDQDHTRTDPNGVDIKDAIFGLGTGTMDPELARYISACRAAILPNWTPLPAILQAHPDLSVQLLVPVAADGKLGEAQLVTGSSDSGFDRSALLAVLKTGRLPKPPGRFRDSAAAGVLITLAARDLQ